MTNLQMWRNAARRMLTDDDPRWHAVGRWLQGEAAVHDGMEPFAELLNMAIKQTGGPTSYIRFGRNPDGNPAMHADTSENATAVCLAYLGDAPPEPPTAPLTAEQPPADHGDGSGAGGGTEGEGAA